MKKENLMKILIPVVSVIVVVESVVLVSNLNKGVSNVETDSIGNEEVEVVKEPVADFMFETETKEMKVGKSYKVSLNLVGKKDVVLDAVEAYVKYDPEKLTVSKLASGEGMPELVKKSGIDTKTGEVSALLWWDIGKYYNVKTDGIDTLVTFMVTPRVEGMTELDLVTSVGDKESVTMMVESSTSEELAFLSNKLEINATK